MRGVSIGGPGVGWDGVAETAESRTEGRFVLSKAEAEETLTMGSTYLKKAESIKKRFA